MRIIEQTTNERVEKSDSFWSSSAEELENMKLLIQQKAQILRIPAQVIYAKHIW